MFNELNIVNSNIETGGYFTEPKKVLLISVKTYLSITLFNNE